MHRGIADRVEKFCNRFGLDVPILEAPMAGSASVARSAAITGAGGMAGFGAVLSPPAEIGAWVRAFRAVGGGPFQLNLWIPGPPAPRDAEQEAAMLAFLGDWGPPVPEKAGDARPPDFAAQCAMLLDVRPAAVSSIMGLFPAAYVAQLKTANIAWLACATTLDEALQAEAAGADAVIAQGIEAGGHRGTFDAGKAERVGVGLMALLPHLSDRLSIPVIAAGGIADGRGIAAALALGASAVQIGTALLAAHEAPAPWSGMLRNLAPEGSVVTRAYTGRPARAVANAYLRAAQMPGAPAAMPYPVQRALTAAMRADALTTRDPDRIQGWAGQAGGLTIDAPAGELVPSWWRQARSLLGSVSPERPT